MHADTAMPSGSGSFDVDTKNSAVRDTNGITMLRVRVSEVIPLGKNTERSLARGDADHFDEHYAD